MRHRRAFTLLELSVVLVVIAVVAAFLLTGMSEGLRTPAVRMDSNSRMRGIHTVLFAYAQSNNKYFPGFDSDGNAIDLTVEYRYQVLLDNNYLTPDYIISPQDALTEWTPGTAVTAANYSYAMLELSTSGHRAGEWRATTNPNAPILSDRNTGTNATTAAQCIWTVTPGKWQGGVAWNDGHVNFEQPNVMPSTQYADGPAMTNDNLFLDGDATMPDDTRAAKGDDAYLIHSGQ